LPQFLVCKKNTRRYLISYNFLKGKDMTHKFILSTIALLSIACQSTYAQTAIFKIADVVREEPSETSAAVSNAALNSKAEVLERKGFWVKVKTAQASGWTKLSAVSIEQTGGSGAGGLSVLTGLASGRVGSGNIVSSAGTRGLSENDLKGSKPDLQAYAYVKTLAANEADALRFAQAGGLKPREISYVQPPAAPEVKNQN
jgi:hypothetical protein